jgi:hypothetical protein
VAFAAATASASDVASHGTSTNGTRCDADAGVVVTKAATARAAPPTIPANDRIRLPWANFDIPATNSLVVAEHHPMAR